MSKKQITYPLVSIIIPVYNSEKYLDECLRSALAQTYTNIEIICINDGSTDNSLRIINTYAKEYSNIKVLTQSNSGIITARNNAITKASGEYILTLDSDDKISADCVKKLYAAIISNPNCAVASPSVEFFGSRKGYYDLPLPTAKNMAFQNCIVNCALFRKELWEKYGGYDLRFEDGIEDYDFWWNFLQDGKEIIRIPDVLFFYRIKNRVESRNIQTVQHHVKLEKIMLKKYPLMKKLRLRQKTLRRAKKYTLQKPKEIVVRSLRMTNVHQWRQYKNYVLNQQFNKDHFVPIVDTAYSKVPPKKVIAHYLPQYYQIPQNDEWFGRGFTEWSNAAKAVPQFTGHWQPHLPIDVGFYNLETTHVMHRQVELAKLYGIYGFSFYYYWFSGGDKIMEKPINNWLNDKSLDFPFMLFWANEDWTNTWGEQADIGTKTYSAKMKPGDAEKFAHDILPFFKDKRYITIEGRPHLIIYQARKDPYLPTFIKELGDLVEEAGLKRPYVSLSFPDDSPETFNPLEFGADAATEFGVHMKIRPDYIQNPVSRSTSINPDARLAKYDMEKFIGERKFAYEAEFPVHRGAMTTYDNTARKIQTGAYLFSLSPYLYKEWLSELIRISNTDFVFVSAWNEWAEGMHLEPDQKFGYAYLQATRDALEEN